MSNFPNLQQSCMLELNGGEAAAIALALEPGVSQILMDETDGRAAAKAMGLRPFRSSQSVASRKACWKNSIVITCGSPCPTVTRRCRRMWMKLLFMPCALLTNRCLLSKHRYDRMFGMLPRQGQGTLSTTMASRITSEPMSWKRDGIS